MTAHARIKALKDKYTRRLTELEADVVSAEQAEDPELLAEAEGQIAAVEGFIDDLEACLRGHEGAPNAH